MIFLLILAFAILVLWEVPKLVREKSWRELIAFSGLMLGAFIMSILITMGVKIPSPVKAIQHLLQDVLHLSYKIWTE